MQKISKGPVFFCPHIVLADLQAVYITEINTEWNYSLFDTHL